MFAHEDNPWEHCAYWGGYAGAYAFSTTALFLMLRFTRKLPASWGIVHVMVITLAITFAGAIVQRLLK